MACNIPFVLFILGDGLPHPACYTSSLSPPAFLQHKRAVCLCRSLSYGALTKGRALPQTPPPSPSSSQSSTFSVAFCFVDITPTSFLFHQGASPTLTGTPHASTRHPAGTLPSLRTGTAQPYPRHPYTHDKNHTTRQSLLSRLSRLNGGISGCRSSRAHARRSTDGGERRAKSAGASGMSRRCEGRGGGDGRRRR